LGEGGGVGVGSPDEHRYEVNQKGKVEFPGRKTKNRNDTLPARRARRHVWVELSGKRRGGFAISMRRGKIGAGRTKYVRARTGQGEITLLKAVGTTPDGGAGVY